MQTVRPRELLSVSSCWGTWNCSGGCKCWCHAALDSIRSFHWLGRYLAFSELVLAWLIMWRYSQHSHSPELLDFAQIARMKQAWSKHEASTSTSKDKALWLDAFKVCIDGLRQKAWCMEQSHFLELFIQENNLSICSLRVPRLYRNNGRLDQLERKTFARV